MSLNIHSDESVSLADRLYQQNVITLMKIRDDWLKEHVNACEVNLRITINALDTQCAKYQFFFLKSQIFEKQSIERINFLRNTVWTHLNQLSQQCVTSDEVKLRIGLL